MLSEYRAVNEDDANDNPAGGSVSGCGIMIVWQDGPLGRGDDRKEPNGAFVETVIDAARQRIEYYQASKFECQENAAAIMHLQAALDCLDSRTSRRESQGTEGTHKGN